MACNIGFWSGSKDWEVFVQWHSYFGKTLFFVSREANNLNKLFNIFNCRVWKLSMKHQLCLEVWAFLFHGHTFKNIFEIFFPTLCKEEVVSHTVTVWIWGNFAETSVQRCSTFFLILISLLASTFITIILINFIKSISKDHQNNNLHMFLTNCYIFLLL